MKITALHSTVLASCLALTAACGGDDGDGPALIDGGNGSDGAPGVDAPVQKTCAIADDLGSPAGLTFSATATDQQDPDNPGAVFLSLIAVIDQGPPIDAVNLQLWPGFGVFDPDLVTGAHTIAGPEADFYNCGACALLIGDFDTNTSMTGMDYVASSGTVNITTASTTVGETIEGSLDNLVFREVTFDDDAQMQTDVANGCTVSLTTLPFTATIEAPMARQPVSARPRRRR